MTTVWGWINGLSLQNITSYVVGIFTYFLYANMTPQQNRVQDAQDLALQVTSPSHEK